MKKENKKQIKKRTLITTISLVLTTAFIAVLLALFITNSIRPNSGLNSAFIDYRTYYDGNQVPIASTDDKPSDKEVTMTDANDNRNTDYSDKTITISTAEELYKFSLSCFINSDFLTYNYILLCNIDYDDTTEKFIPIGWSDTQEKQFTGTFDGQGHDIKNLEMVIINSGNYGTYANMNYFAMFAEVGSTGKVKNFGLIEPTVTLAYLVTNMANNGVANVAGLNEGEISGVYVNSLGTDLVDECGITAAGGYRISGFVLKNSGKGSISDCYYATNSVYNYTLTDVVEFADIVLDSEGESSVSKTYFIDKSIKSFTTAEDKITITYVPDLGAKAKTLDNYEGTYVEDEAALCTAFASNTNWSIKASSKDAYEYYYAYTTPVRRKFVTNPTIVSRGTDDSGDTVITELSINITNVQDFLFAYELMNNDGFYASSKITYNITADLNLSGIPASAYAYGRAIAATFKGTAIENGTVELVDGRTNSYTTIYNADILNSARKVSTTGLDTYGLFPYLTGKVENLNVVVKNQKLDNIEESTNAKAIGGIAGYIELGEVNNVNVYMTLSNTTSSTLGEYYLGGICGVLGGEGKVKDSTVTGEFDIKADSSYSAAIGYMSGIAVGGVIGYIEDSVGDVETLLNAVSIKTNLGSSGATYAIGGVIGAGYTREAKYLENIETVSVGSSDVTPTYTKLYVAGIIGRHLGETGETSEQAEVNNFTNQGNVSVYGNSDASLTMVAGIENADIQTATTEVATVTPSKFVDKENNILFYASAMTNRANITINGTTNANTLHTSGINVCTGNGFKSVISSIYNLDNNKIYQTLKEGTDEETLDTSRSTKEIGTAQTVDMSVSSNYAGLVNVYNKNTKDYKAQKNNPELNSLHLVSAYNLRDIVFTMSGAIAADSIYSAVANGSFIDYDDIRNEGSMTFELSKASATKRNLYINGVFDEISLGNYAKNIYNGGNITITDSATSDVKVDIYVSGICRNNKAVISDINQKPIESTFDSSLFGSLDNVINNGNILVTSSDYDKDTLTITKTENNLPVKNSQTSTTNLVGNVYAAGISYTNSGIISNAFNLGDITIDVFSRVKSYYYVGGIACHLTEADDTYSYAQIRDSANNGRLQVINMCNSVEAYVMVGGIIAQNTNADENIRSTIAFTINYGTLIAFNGYNKTANADIGKLHSLVGGISAKGLCNIVNVLNYGNIYGSEAVGSMIGAFDLSNYKNETVYLANTINYGNVLLVRNYRYVSGNLEHATYNVIIDATHNTIIEDPSFLHNGTYNATNQEYYYLGSMFGFINYNSQTNISVRYVINFYSGAMIVQEVNERNVPTTSIDTSTFMTVDGYLDKFGGGSVKYTPLSSIDENGNVGVFSKSFIFRRAINGDPTAIDLNNYITDAYITDFFQFVRFDKVNEVLLEKIGWKNIAYLNAAEELAKNVKVMAKFVSDGYAGLAKTDTIVKPSFESSTWYENIDETLLLNFLNEALSNNDGNTTEFSSSDLKDILEYILFDNSCISDISTSIRSSIVNTIISYYDKLSTNYSTLLQTLLYDELLAKVVSGEDVNYTAVQNKIKQIIDAAGTTTQKKILDNYLELLLDDTNNEILNPLFSEDVDYYVQKKMELITTLLDGYSTETLGVIADEILTGSSASAADKLKYANYLKSHESDALDIYAKVIAANSFSGNTEFLSAINKSLTRYYSNDLLNEDDYDADENIVDDFTSVEETYSWINGEKWYYSKNYTELWNIIKRNPSFQNYISANIFNNTIDDKGNKGYQDPTSGLYNPSIIAKATEFTNTYQCNDEPSKRTEVDLTTDDYATYKAYAGEELPDVYGGNNVGSYDIRNGGIYRNSDDNSANNPYQPGLTGQNQEIKNRFIYTPDSVNSYATYYYGPYMANGKVFDEKWKNRYDRDKEIYEPTAVTDTTKSYAPVFISTNKNIVDNAIANSHTTSSKTNANVFYWNNYNTTSSKYQWVSDYILNNAQGDGSNYLFYNFKDSLSDDDYIVDGYDFSPDRHTTKAIEGSETNKTFATYTARVYYDKNNKNNYVDYSFTNLTITLNVTTNQTYGNLDGKNGSQRHPLRDLYLKGYVTSCIITGIWDVHSCWKPNVVNGCYLTSKEDNNNSPSKSNYNSYRGIHTTQYTRYLMDDLVNLDGVQTKGKRDGRDDEDEIGIISAIMTKILSEDEGKKVVVKALGEYAQTNNFSASQSASAKFLATALKGTSFAKDAVINVISQQDKEELENEYYTFVSLTENQTLYDKLDSFIRSYSFSDLNELSMAGAMDKEVFKKILLLTLYNNVESYDNDVGTNTITDKDVTYYIYKFAESLRAEDPNITDAQIATYLSQISSSDLTAFTELSKLTWTEFINTVGGDADASQSITSWGGSLNVTEMFYRIKYIYNNTSNATWASTVSYNSDPTSHSSYPKANYALPFVVSNDVDQTTYNNLGSDGTLVANNYEVVDTNNIGYFTGNGAKLDAKSIANTFTYSGDLTGSAGNYTNFKIYTSADSTQNSITEVTNLDTNIHESILKMLNDTSGLAYAIRLNTQVDMNNYLSMNSITVAGQTYNSSVSYLPSNGVWFVPQQDGVVKIVLATRNNGASGGFEINMIERNSSDDPNNPYHGRISGKTVINTVYVNDTTGEITYNDTDSTGKTLVYDHMWTTGLQNGRMIYFEIPVKVGYEYALGQLNSGAPYLMYLDLGQNGDGSTKVKYPDLTPIETNYNKYYSVSGDSTLTKYGNYLASNMIKTYPTNTTSITVSEPTILLVKATTGGKITIGGQTTYLDDNSVTTSISSVSKNTNGTYRAFYLSGGDPAIEYTITATDTTITDIITVEKDNYITYTPNDIDTANTITYTNGSEQKIIFKGTNYANLSSMNLNIDMTNEIKETLYVVYPSMITGTDPNKEYYFFNDATKGDSDVVNIFTSTDKKDIIKLLANADYLENLADEEVTTVLDKLIVNLNSSYYDDLLLSITADAVRKNIVKKIIAIANTNSTTYADTEDLIIAAYLGQDYLNYSSSKQLTHTKLYTLLGSYSSPAGSSTSTGDTTAGFYQFISGESTIDATKFEAFLEHLGISSNLNGYGIFALASSHGIKNGAFIPDNVDLLSMDDPYDKTAKDDYNTSIIKLTVNSDPAVDEVISTSWRDNTGKSSKTGAQGTITYDTSITTSVNHAFRIEMKQLKLAISTTIFELDLDDTSDVLDEIFATSSTIDVDNGTITYYVPTLYVDTLKDKTEMPISYIKYAETATYKTNNNNTTTINLTGGTVKDGIYEVYSAITVTAEDTTVINNYTIRIIGISLDFTVTSDKNSIGYSGETVTLTISTTNIPNSFDFKSFFSIVNGTTTYKATDTNPGFVFNSSTRNNGIVTGVTNGLGSATLVIDVLSSLPGGTEEFTIKAFDITRTVSITKDTNTENYITKLEFEGVDLATNNVYSDSSSTIKFGRAYDYSELTDYTSDNFYLSAFEISDNATVESITATYKDISGNRIQYVVTFKIKSESGVTETYTHTLSEMNQFNGTYATLYKDGVSLSESQLHKENFIYNGTTMNKNKVSLNYSSGVYAAALFNRGETPEYRIKYILTNFYTLGDDITYHITDATKSNGTSVSESYLGLTATFSEKNEPGTFKYEYVYESTGTWENGVKYTRSYTFPALYIILGYSRDALLHRLTFLDQSVIIGNTASVMKINSNSSTAILAGDTTTAVDNHEVTYQNIFKDSSRDIEIKGKTIKYSSGTDDTSITDYYAIGTVANADLNNYSPTFAVEEHGNIFQYTTIEKLQYYGSGKQYSIDPAVDKSDAEVLTNHDTLLLYIPFVKNNQTEILIVELEKVTTTNNGITKQNYIWKNVYDRFYDGADTGSASSHFIGAYTNSKTTLDMMSNPTNAAIAGYTLSDECGKLTSSALYMDYIGTPVENHFWYVSYVVFSEAALHGELDEGNMRYYHISIVDAVNTIYFEVKLYAPADFAAIEKNQTLYMTISENIYNDTTKTSTRQISGYLVAQTDEDGDFVTGTDSHNNGLVLYKLRFKLQTLPRGYFYFSIDLPNGYVVTATTDMKNQLYKSNITAEDGSFLPYTSIITKTVQLEFVVREGEDEAAKAWAIATSDIYTRDATYIEGYRTVSIGSSINVSSIIPSDTTGTVTWESSNEDVLTVSSTGDVTGVSAGVAVVTATKDGKTFKVLVQAKQ